MRVLELSIVEQMLQAARAAARCRDAVFDTEDGETRDALIRAAARYSGRVSELASELLRGGRGI